MTAKDRLETYLEQHGVRFQERHHATCYTAQEVAAAEHLSGRTFGKAVLAMADGELEVLVVPASRRVDFRKAATALGARDLHLATERQINRAFPDCESGAALAFGNLYDIPVWLDSSLAEQPTLTLEAGTHSETVDLPSREFLRTAHPKVAELTAG